MTAGAPAWLVVDGLRDDADRAAVVAAIHARDPAAEVTPVPGRDLFALRSAVPAQALREAVQAAGFIAALRDHPPAEITVAGVAGVLAAMVGQGLLGLALGGAAGLAAGLALLALDPACRSPGDSGGCAMGIPMFAIAGALVGAPVAAVLAAFRKLRR